MLRTGHFEIDADAPVGGALGAVNVEVPKPDFTNALGNDTSLFFARDTYFLATKVVRRVEAVHEEEMFIAQRGGWM